MKDLYDAYARELAVGKLTWKGIHIPKLFPVIENPSPPRLMLAKGRISGESIFGGSRAGKTFTSTCYDEVPDVIHINKILSPQNKEPLMFSTESGITAKDYIWNPQTEQVELKKEPPMTSKEMLALQPYNSTSECPICGCAETDDKFFGTGVWPGDTFPGLRIIHRCCKNCHDDRYELPLDWDTGENAGEAKKLVVWCAALGRKEAAEATLKELSA